MGEVLWCIIGRILTNTTAEAEIRTAIIKADLVDCMVALPAQLFFSTQIPVCLWFLTRNKNDGKSRNRQGKVLFIDARKMGTLIDRVHRDLTDEDIEKMADIYHAWKSGKEYEDVAGFCKSATLEEIQEKGYVLTPGRFVGAAQLEEDNEPFEQKVERLTKTLQSQMKEANELDSKILATLEKLRYGN
jgi:type I restriction enzyme M protein